MSNPIDDDHMHASKIFQENSEDTMESYKDWKNAIRDNVDFDDKTRELLGLAAAAAVQCQYCVHTHGQKALKHGATDKEVSDVIQIASQVKAGATMSYGIGALEHSEE